MPKLLILRVDDSFDPDNETVFDALDAGAEWIDTMPAMKRYTRDTLSDVQSGWYWAKRYAGAELQAVPVIWQCPESHALRARRLVIDFGYRSEAIIYPDHPEQSDNLDEGFVLLGPIPVPED